MCDWTRWRSWDAHRERYKEIRWRFNKADAIRQGDIRAFEDSLTSIPSAPLSAVSNK